MLTLTIFTFANCIISILCIVILVLFFINKTTAEANELLDLDLEARKGAIRKLEKLVEEKSNVIANQASAIQRLSKERDDYSQSCENYKAIILSFEERVLTLQHENEGLLNHQLPIFVNLNKEVDVEDPKDLKAYKGLLTVAKKLVNKEGLNFAKLVPIKTLLHLVEQQETEY